MSDLSFKDSGLILSRIRPKRSIFKKTFALSLLMVLIISILLPLLIIPDQKKSLVRNLESEAKIALASVGQTIATAIIASDYSYIIDHCLVIINAIPTIEYVVVAREGGFTLVHFRDHWEQLDGYSPLFPGETGTGQLIVSPLTEKPVYHFTTPFLYSAGKWGYLEIGFSRKNYDVLLQKTYLKTALIAVSFLLSGILLAYFFARGIGSNIMSLTHAVRRIGMGDFTATVDIRTEDEIEELGNAFNSMVNALNQSQTDLLEANQYIQNIISSTNDALLVSDQTGRITTVNQACIKLTGYSSAEFLSLNLYTLFPGEEKCGILCELIQNRRSFNNRELLLCCKSGSAVPILASGSPINDDDSGHLGTVLALRDISELKEAQENLLFRSKFESMITMISNRFINLPTDEVDSGINLSLSLVGEFLSADRCYLFQFSSDLSFFTNTHEWCRKGISVQIDKLQNLKTEDFSFPVDIFSTFENLLITSLADIPVRGENFRRELEKEGICSVLNVPIEYKGALFGFIGVDSCEKQCSWSREVPSLLKIVGEILTNALKRKHSEEALAEEKERLAVTLRSIGDAVIATDTHGIITNMNKTAENLTGWKQEEALGKKLSEVFLIQDEVSGQPRPDLIAQVMDSGSIQFLENNTALISKSGLRIIVADSIAPITDQDSRIIGTVLVFRDITEERRVEDELRKAQKLESLGVMAGGIAHDFNNLLTGLLGNISLAKDEIVDGTELAEIIYDAEEAANRCRKLTQQLLTFAKGGAPIKKAVLIPELLEEIAKFTLRGTNVKYRVVPGHSLFRIEADETQIAQVFQNIIINAAQAMPAGGEIVLNIENINLSLGDSSLLPPGDYVRIRIRDTGPGIPPTALEKIFDPFFTTKAKGSGLGLAVSHSIIKKHEGSIRVSFTGNQGTEFEIMLPAIQASEPEQSVQTVAPISWNARLLLMDDEEIVHKIAGKIFTRFGFSYHGTYNADDTISEFNRALDSGVPFDLVILDLTIPGGRGGKEVVRELKMIDPLVKVVVSSGYSTDPIMSDYESYGFSGVVAKPYKYEELISVLNRLLVHPAG